MAQEQGFSALPDKHVRLRPIALLNQREMRRFLASLTLWGVGMTTQLCPLLRQTLPYWTLLINGREVPRFGGPLQQLTTRVGRFVLNGQRPVAPDAANRRDLSRQPAMRTKWLAFVKAMHI